jgi:hypothetical protein
MRSFLVEGYVAGREPAQLEALARRADRVAAESRAVRYLGSLVIPEDEVCFHVFEAPSLAALVQASSRAALAHDRVVETVLLRQGRDEAEFDDLRRPSQREGGSG